MSFKMPFFFLVTLLTVDLLASGFLPLKTPRPANSVRYCPREPHIKAEIKKKCEEIKKALLACSETKEEGSKFCQKVFDKAIKCEEKIVTSTERS